MRHVIDMVFKFSTVLFVLFDVWAWRYRQTNVPWWYYAGKLHLFEPAFYTAKGNRLRIYTLLIALVCIASMLTLESI